MVPNERPTRIQRTWLLMEEFPPNEFQIKDQKLIILIFNLLVFTPNNNKITTVRN